ncbi:hypothetical protein CPB84DRAFT_1678661, partial [Gymnopilus junonius]
FFSALEPTTMDIEMIRGTPMPPLAIVKQLTARINPHDTQSIHCPHAPGLSGEHFPTWILSYWVKVARIWPLKRTWVLAEESLEAWSRNKKRTDQTKGIITCIYNALSCTSWSGKIQSFLASITTDHLAPYMMKNWLMDEQKNQMLYLLECKLSRSRKGDGICVTDTFFMTKLTEIYQ